MDMAAAPSPQQQQPHPDNPWGNGTTGQLPLPHQGHMAGNPSTSGPGPLPPRLPGTVSSAPQNFGPPMPMQFRPGMAPQNNQQFMPPNSQQFRPVGQGMLPPGMGNTPIQPQPMQYTPQMQHMPPLPGQLQQVAPATQASPMSYIQQPRPMSNVLPPAQQVQQQSSQPITMVTPTGMGAVGIQTASYTFGTSAPYGQSQSSFTIPSQFQPVPQAQQITVPQSSAQQWGSSGQNVISASQGLQTGSQSVSVSSTLGTVQPTASNGSQNLSDWQEHTAADGRRYYYNKKTKQSSWEKPYELMTSIERADASTVWKEFTTPDGRKYYYNKDTKQSKWVIPEELKIAREQAEKAAVSVGNVEGSLSTAASPVPVAVAASPSKASPHLSTLNTPASTATNVVSTPVTSTVTPSGPAISVGAVSTSIVTPVPAVTLTMTTVPLPSVANVNVTEANALTTKTSDNINTRDLKESVVEEASAQDLEEAKKTMPVAGKVNVTPLAAEKANDEEPIVYATKTEAKNAFKELLESAHVEADWTWDQAMRVIINDRRYGALKTLGERKQAFNEYLAQRKKHEAEERRIRQKKAREDFMKMLEECKELTSSTRWSKAVSLFEDDPRFLAVDRGRDREELFETYLSDLERKVSPPMMKSGFTTNDEIRLRPTVVSAVSVHAIEKEREKAREERKHNLAEYRAFLESCDFIKVNTQWRKIQDRLEDDERCSRLDKIDRLEIFQEYIRDLERQEEEERRIQKEQLRRKERRNRDEFRKLLEEHKESGMLTAKTHWRDYCIKIKEHPAYLAVASNTSGSTPKDLFEDVVEDLEKQYNEDKTRIKDAMKSGKFQVTSAWTYDEFKAAVAEVTNLASMSEVNIKLVFEEVLERTREKEEKEAKKRQKLADEFLQLLYSIKEITALSRWEDCKPLLEELSDYRAVNDDEFRREIFEQYISHLQERAKEKERKREEEKAKKEKEKEEKEKEREKRKEKEREREKEKEKRDKERDREKAKERYKRDRDSASDSIDMVNNHAQKEERRKEKDRKHRKRHTATNDDVSSGKEDKEETKRSHKHSSERKKSSRKHGYESGSESDGRHKRHKRDRDASRRNGALEELEDGEVGEDGA